jgi:chromosome segregation ATPase
VRCINSAWLFQRSNLNTNHAQVTLERLRLQQQQVDRLDDKLGGTRAHIARLQIDKSRLQEDIPRLEAQLSQESDPGKRRELEIHQQAIKLEIERFLDTISQEREMESQIIGQLQIEQAKLNELNGRLDTLQKELENVDKPQQNGKRQ